MVSPAELRSQLEKAKAAGVHSVWLQPDTFTPDDVHFASKSFKTLVVGADILVDGKKAAATAGKKLKH